MDALTINFGHTRTKLHKNVPGAVSFLRQRNERDQTKQHQSGQENCEPDRHGMVLSLARPGTTSVISSRNISIHFKAACFPHSYYSQSFHARFIPGLTKITERTNERTNTLKEEPTEPTLFGSTIRCLQGQGGRMYFVRCRNQPTNPPTHHHRSA